jgi:hypothetical protein
MTVIETSRQRSTNKCPAIPLKYQHLNKIISPIHFNLQQTRNTSYSGNLLEMAGLEKLL